MRIRRFTPALERLFNFVGTDRGRPLSDITHRLDYEGLVEDVQRVRESFTKIEREVASDSGRWYVVRISPYRSLDDGHDGVVITFFDNTRQKRVEEELREAKTVAEEANLTKATFLATLSHEFRTPLNAILGYTDLLQIEGLGQAQQHKVDRIRAGNWHLASMIDEILDFATVDRGQETLRTEQLDAREIAREACVLIEPTAVAKGLVFLVDLPDAPVELVTDSAKARQILANLCGNAVKYTESGTVRLRVATDGDRALFEVIDTGLGIAEGDRERIFERFWQVDRTSTRNFAGIGIGLAAARAYARLLGGDIDVDSEAGKGSTFTLWLPILSSAPESIPSSRPDLPEPIFG